MRDLLAVLALLALVVEGVGCTTSSTVTEPDRQVMDQSAKGVAIAIDKITQAAASAGDAARPALNEARVALGVVQENLAQQVKAHGAPEGPTEPFSASASEKWRGESDKSHEGTPWGAYAMGALGTIAGIAGAFFGMPWISQVFPALTGNIGKLAKAGVQAVTKIREQAEANGGTIHVKDLLAIHKDEQVRAGVQEFAAAAAKKVEEKFDIEHALGLGSPESLPAAPAPAPAATATP